MRQCRRGPDGSPSEADLAEFIRVRTSRKIPSALVAASLINAENAPEVQSVTRLLKALTFE